MIKSINIKNSIICVIIIFIFIIIKSPGASMPNSKWVWTQPRPHPSWGCTRPCPTQGGLDASTPSLGYVRAPPSVGAQLSATWRLGTPERLLALGSWQKAWLASPEHHLVLGHNQAPPSAWEASMRRADRSATWLMSVL